LSGIFKSCGTLRRVEGETCTASIFNAKPSKSSLTVWPRRWSQSTPKIRQLFTSRQCIIVHKTSKSQRAKRW
jgi:hypothetical protein